MTTDERIAALEENVKTLGREILALCARLDERGPVDADPDTGEILPIKKPRKKADPKVSNDFREAMVTKYENYLNREAVLFEIEASLAHKAVSNWKKPELYVQTWLNRACRDRAGRKTVPTAAQVRIDSRDKYVKDFYRQQERVNNE